MTMTTNNWNGPTGYFPKGKLNDEDEGELQFSIAADKQRKVALINFGTPVKWVGLPKEELKTFIDGLNRCLREIDDEYSNQNI